MYKYMHIYTHMYVCMYVCIHTHMYSFCFYQNFHITPSPFSLQDVKKKAAP